MGALRLYWTLVSVRLRGQMQYRLPFLLDITATFLGSFVDFVALAGVFSRFRSVGGWSLGEVALLYGLAEIPFALKELSLCGYDYDFFAPLVRQGQLDQMLLRPLSLPMQLVAAEFPLRRLGRLSQAVLVFALGLHLTPIAWSAAKLLYLPIVGLSALAFFAAIDITGSTACFWTVERLEVFNLFSYGGAAMLSFPMHIYHVWLRRFFTFVVPAALVVYYPALFLLDKPDPFGLPRLLSFLAPLAGLGTLAAACAFWRFGVRHYQSTGT